jgi:UDP-N-acetylenolpyruvoylglucosamine reductase
VQDIEICSALHKIKTMKVKILKNTKVKGKHLEAGKEAEVSEKDAKILIGLGKAEAKEATKK